MTIRFRAVAAAALALSLAPVTARAAQIQADRSCYLDGPDVQQTIAVSGNGFDPGQPFQIALDGKSIPGSGRVIDGAGGLAGDIPVPVLPSKAIQRRHTLAVSQGAHRAATAFSVSRFAADFAPASGDPRTLRVRFSAFGFGTFSAKPATVFLHYVRPDRKLKKTIRLGRGSGPCGSISRSHQRKLFPFKVSPGLWQLQFDASRTYRRPAKGKFGYFRVPVKITRVSR